MLALSPQKVIDVLNKHLNSKPATNGVATYNCILHVKGRKKYIERILNTIGNVNGFDPNCPPKYSNKVPYLKLVNATATDLYFTFSYPNYEEIFAFVSSFVLQWEGLTVTHFIKYDGYAQQQQSFINGVLKKSRIKVKPGVFNAADYIA